MQQLWCRHPISKKGKNYAEYGQIEMQKRMAFENRESDQ